MKDYDKIVSLGFDVKGKKITNNINDLTVLL